MKYPHLEDYAVRAPERPFDRLFTAYLSQLALKEHDEKQLYVSRQHLNDLRSIYAILTDILHKNIEKVTSYDKLYAT